MPSITGPFEIKRTAYEVHEAASGLIGRHALSKQYHGELDATGIGEMLSAGTATPGSAGYVAIEKVLGSLAGRRGSFYLQHNGTLNRGDASLTIHVIPDSATDELQGLKGTMRIEIAEGGLHSYVFDYDL
ncbi:MAG: DUF3224 domain-containing protein [Asticcacaulis sp.]|nr:DUF3224 domain-containing protein [Asticcacaulis sp.]